MAIASFPNNIAIHSIQQLRWLELLLRCRLQLPWLESRDWNLNQMAVRLRSEDPSSRFFSWIDISVEMMTKKKRKWKFFDLSTSHTTFLFTKIPLRWLPRANPMVMGKGGSAFSPPEPLRNHETRCYWRYTHINLSLKKKELSSSCQHMALDVLVCKSATVAGQTTRILFHLNSPLVGAPNAWSNHCIEHLTKNNIAFLLQNKKGQRPHHLKQSPVCPSSSFAASAGKRP